MVEESRKRTSKDKDSEPAKHCPYEKKSNTLSTIKRAIAANQLAIESALVTSCIHWQYVALAGQCICFELLPVFLLLLNFSATGIVGIFGHRL